MKCWICKRQARGFGHTDNRFGLADPRRYPIDWVFCSQRCLEAFHVLYNNWVCVQEGRTLKTEVVMMNPTDVELAAMKKCLKAFAEAAEGIGSDKPLGAYTETEAMRLIEAIVTRYTEAMVEHHEASKYPPVRGLKDYVSDPFDDTKADPSVEYTKAQVKTARPVSVKRGKESVATDTPQTFLFNQW